MPLSRSPLEPLSRFYPTQSRPAPRPKPYTIPRPAHSASFPPPPSLPAKPRKPKHGNNIAPSDFRPPALAKDRLHTWSSPFSRAKEAELRASLPADEVNRIYAAIFAAFAPDTHLPLRQGLLRFHQYCDSISIDEEARMPASAALISAFVSKHVGLVGETPSSPGSPDFGPGTTFIKQPGRAANPG
ncbi:DNA breaking-rejoining enzyme [Mycena indigotica]|uniref:DNA breaking-rejoining enzyme n=1 Tax=Mycena indigotica TaxID=2126181 RepID=A0A8H6TG28_9AGAR|nr:DNA breaking-rejoining enzyme [Mycena indigotica]KAF7315100.1 DNA breaking-rejoining enzyme [Mycena indigotica]